MLVMCESNTYVFEHLIENNTSIQRFEPFKKCSNPFEINTFEFLWRFKPLILNPLLIQDCNTEIVLAL